MMVAWAAGQTDEGGKERQCYQCGPNPLILGQRDGSAEGFISQFHHYSFRVDGFV